MKLRDVLAVISGGTEISISVNCKTVFCGCMSDVTKDVFNKVVGDSLDNEVYRLNAIDNTITIAC